MCVRGDFNITFTTMVKLQQDQDPNESDSKYCCQMVNSLLKA